MSFETTGPATTGAIITCRDDLVHALRARKAELGLSNSFVDHALLMASGGTDKILGPSQAKGLTLTVALDMIELFGGRLIFQIDPQAEARMQARWERREEGQVRRQKRVSKKLTNLVVGQFFKRLSKLGNEARKVKLPREARASIARAAAHSRWRAHRAAARTSAIAEVSA